jgi:hypothetical protein
MTRRRKSASVPRRRCEIRHVEVPSGAGVTWPLLARRDPWAGVAVAHISPDSTTEHQLLRDILDGLAKNAEVSGWDRSVDSDRAVVPVWLAAHPIDHLVVVDAQAIPIGLLEIVAGACAVAGTTLWLCEKHPGDDYLAMRAQWPTSPATLPELLAALPEPAPATTEAAFPDVPFDGPMTFLAACRDRLDPTDHAVVADRFHQVAEAAATWAGNAGDLDEPAVLGWLRDRIDGCRRVPEMLTVVRATQVAMFTLAPTGYHLQVDLPRLLATADHAPEAVAADPSTWRALAAYRDPARGAACALAAAGAGIDDLATMGLDDLAADGVTATATDGTSFEVPPDAAVYLRAQHLARRSEGADGTDLVFAEEDQPVRGRMLVKYVRAPVTDLGIALTTKALTNVRADAKRWASRWGVSVQQL